MLRFDREDVPFGIVMYDADLRDIRMDRFRFAQIRPPSVSTAVGEDAPQDERAAAADRHDQAFRDGKKARDRRTGQVRRSGMRPRKTGTLDAKPYPAAPQAGRDRVGQHTTPPRQSAPHVDDELIANARPSAGLPAAAPILNDRKLASAPYAKPKLG